MIKKFRQHLSQNLQNISGRRITRPTLVIESDDWGLLRMQGKESFENLRIAGIAVDRDPYCLHDFLETEEELQQLFDLQLSLRDSRGRPLVITANTIMANPDYKRIADERFDSWYYLDLEETYNALHGNARVLGLMKQGAQAGFFVPQLHGREHLQVPAWLKALREGHSETLLAFKQGVCTHPSRYFKSNAMNFQSALHLRNEAELDFGRQAVQEGSELFAQHFGYRSGSFIAPRFIWPQAIETSLRESGIEVLQGKIFQFTPGGAEGEQLHRRLRFQGERSTNGMTHLVRNVFFEPAQMPKFDWVGDALQRIRTAFYWKKPAIISMHRLNLVDGMEAGNAAANRSQLSKLIKQVIKEYPAVEFCDSYQLAKTYFNTEERVLI